MFCTNEKFLRFTVSCTKQFEMNVEATTIDNLIFARDCPQKESLVKSKVFNRSEMFAIVVKKLKSMINIPR